MQNISFTSKINFVPEQKFLKVKCSGLRKYLGTSDHATTNSNLWTDQVCSCTALFLVSMDKVVNGFHFLSSTKRASKRLETILNKQLGKNEVDKGLIIGARKFGHKFSLEVFERVSGNVEKRSSDVSVFKNQVADGWTDIHYSPSKDTYTIFSESLALGPVESVDNLKHLYREISIAPNDELYINCRHMSKKKYPELFRY